MPKYFRNVPRPTRARRLVWPGAIAATLLLAIGGTVAATSVAQSAAAEEAEQKIAAQQDAFNDLMRAADAIRTERMNEANAIAAQKAAELAAYLATPAGAQETARNLGASQYGWGDDQFSCLVSLWDRESGWNVNSYNASSGATGIPQALPGEKMAIAGADWQTNPATQIAWGLGYISSSYGTPCGAWNHSENYNWY